MDTEIEVRKMECKEIRVDIRNASIKESTEGQQKVQKGNVRQKYYFRLIIRCLLLMNIIIY